jgi:hypothetical protein
MKILTLEKKKDLKKHPNISPQKSRKGLGMVVHAYNFSYLGGRDRRMLV